MTGSKDQPETRRDPNGGGYQLAPGQEPDDDVVTVVGAKGEPGKAVPRKEWESWPATEVAAAQSSHDDLVERGNSLIEGHGSLETALAATHPDADGNPEDFRAVQAAQDRAA